MTTRKADWSKRTARKSAGTTVTLDDTIAVPVTPAVAWTRLEDVRLVASCLPGLDPATLVPDGPSAFRARMTNTVMGITANWDLKATINPNVSGRKLSVVLEGEDSRLGMRLNGVADVLVRSDDIGQALLDYTADLRVDGSLAAMGGPVIRSILSDAIAQFVAVVGGQEPTGTRSLPARLRARVRDLWTRVTRKFGRTNATRGNQ